MTSKHQTAGHYKGVADRGKRSRHLRRTVTFHATDAFFRLSQMVLDDPSRLRQMPDLCGLLRKQGDACVDGLEVELAGEDPEAAEFPVTLRPPEARARGPPCQRPRSTVNVRKTIDIFKIQPRPSRGANAGGFIPMIPKSINLPLKMVTDRIKSNRAVTWALDTFGGPLLVKLELIFGPLLEEGQVTPFETQLTLFQKKLTVECEAVVATDRAYRDQRAQETKFRLQRNQDLADVNSKVVILRQAFGGIYSDEKLAEMGFARRTPQQPGELFEQATHLAFRLNEPNFDLSEAKVDGFQVDLPQAVAGLGPAAEKLGASIDNLTREERRTEAAMLAKDGALEEYNRSFLYIARSVESFLRLAGFDEVARRVRPSSRRPGETLVPFEEPADEAPGGDASPEASSEPPLPSESQPS